MQVNTLKHKLAAGKPATIIAPVGATASLVEQLGQLHFDGVFIDCEHGPSNWQEVEDMVRAADLAGYSSVVRVDRNDGPTITRALDRGAGGVQVPHVNTAADALAAVQFAKFAPLGHRGWAGGRAAYGVAAADFAQHANEQTLVAVMIEEAEALHNLDEMLRVEHVDVFFVAPGDLAQSMGFAGLVDHPSVVGAMDDALRRIRAAGRVSGTLTSPAQLDHHLESGVQYLYVALPALLAPSAATFVGRVASGS